MSKEYYYYDAKDGTTAYCPHTCTDADNEPRESGAEYREKIVDGGDFTTAKKSVLPIDALGSGYFDKKKHMNHVS